MNTFSGASLRAPFHPRARRLAGVSTLRDSNSEEMPSKIIVETEDIAMENEVDTAAEAKILKVSTVDGVNLYRLRKHTLAHASSFLVRSLFGNMWLSVLTSASRVANATELSEKHKRETSTRQA